MLKSAAIVFEIPNEAQAHDGRLWTEDVPFRGVSFWDDTGLIASTVCASVLRDLVCFLMYTSSTAQGGGGSFRIGNL